MKKRMLFASGAAAALIAMSGAAHALVTIDPDGTGFVGKGDVQTVAGWNNKQLQDNAASVAFRVSARSASTWTCTRVVELGNGSVNEIVQQRATTTTTQGVLSSAARENSKGKDGSVTGFHLLGYAGPVTVTVDGPAVGSCPAGPSGFVFDDNVETTQLDGGLQVSVDGDWVTIG